MGFSANEFYLPFEAFAAGGVTANLQVVIPRDCEFVGVVLAVGTNANTDVKALSVRKNQATAAPLDTTVDVSLTALAANTGDMFYPDARIFFTKFDTVQLISDGAGADTPTVSGTYIFRI